MHKISFFVGSEPPQTPENIADELSIGRALSPFASSFDMRMCASRVAKWHMNYRD